MGTRSEVEDVEMLSPTKQESFKHIILSLRAAKFCEPSTKKSWVCKGGLLLIVGKNS